MLWGLTSCFTVATENETVLVNVRSKRRTFKSHAKQDLKDRSRAERF